MARVETVPLLLVSGALPKIDANFQAAGKKVPPHG
jgi:hypothetical protein